MHPVSILQISDLHVLPETGATMLGIDTEHYFQRVLDQALADHPSLDLILVTGDLAQHPTAASYRRIAAKLASCGVPSLCLPGNHDDLALMQAELNAAPISCNKRAFVGEWQIIALYSQVAGQPGGYLCDEELRFLEDCLQDAPNRPALIAVHHHSLPMQSAWLDTMIIENGDELLTILSRYPTVKALTCGHVHQEIDRRAGTLRILSAPSTCFQFAPLSTTFSIAASAPGYRVFKLYSDGRLDTAVFRLPEIPSGLRLNVDPY